MRNPGVEVAAGFGQMAAKVLLVDERLNLLQRLVASFDLVLGQFPWQSKQHTSDAKGRGGVHTSATQVNLFVAAPQYHTIMLFIITTTNNNRELIEHFQQLKVLYKKGMEHINTKISGIIIH